LVETIKKNNNAIASRAIKVSIPSEKYQHKVMLKTVDGIAKNKNLCQLIKGSVGLTGSVGVTVVLNRVLHCTLFIFF